MNAVAEALGLSLTGCAAIPAPYRERAQMAYATGRRICELVLQDVRPSSIMTREAFENAIAVASALMWASYTIFWAIPSKYLKGSAAAGGIALINSIGLLGGFVSPNIMGMAKEMTNSLMAGWVVMAVLLVLGGVSLLIAFAIKKEA